MRLPSLVSTLLAAYPDGVCGPCEALLARRLCSCALGH
jgi:hypothetical protein